MIKTFPTKDEAHQVATEAKRDWNVTGYVDEGGGFVVFEQRLGCRTAWLHEDGEFRVPNGRKS